MPKKPPVRMHLSVDSTAAYLINTAALRSGTSASAVVSGLARRLLTEVPARSVVDPAHEEATALADVELEAAAAHLDESRGWRAAG